MAPQWEGDLDLRPWKLAFVAHIRARDGAVSYGFPSDLHCQVAWRAHGD
jgi:hypothetical protein